MSCFDQRAVLVLAAIVVACGPDLARAAGPPKALDSGLKPEDVEKRRYVDYARECIDLIMRYGTDRYGKVHSPILMNIVDVRDRSCPADPLPLDERWRVVRRGRRGPGGANLYVSQPTIRAVDALTSVTGERKYTEFVDKSLDYYLTNLVDKNGLLWWGFHRHYDAHKDVMTGHSGNHHEIHIQQAIWPILWRANRRAVTREIEAVWKWHVIDKKTGEINRHADGHRGCDFAMTGGEILYSFAFLYSQTKDAKWLDRAKLLADYYWTRRDSETNLVANRPNAGRDRFDGSHIDTSVVGLFCQRLLASYVLTHEPFFREQALVYLKAHARLGYDDKAKQFWGSLNLDGSPVPGPRVSSGYAGYEPRGHIDMWEPYIAGYECPIYAAQTCAHAHKLTQDKVMLETAAKWFGCIRRVWPPRRCNGKAWYAEYARDWAPHGTYAGLYGRTISFALRMHDLTKDPAYLEFARTAAKEAVSKLYYRGMLRGHPLKPYYEEADGVGYLLNALIQLDQMIKKGGTDEVSLDNF